MTKNTGHQLDLTVESRCLAVHRADEGSGTAAYHAVANLPAKPHTGYPSLRCVEFFTTFDSRHDAAKPANSRRRGTAPQRHCAV